MRGDGASAAHLLARFRAAAGSCLIAEVATGASPFGLPASAMAPQSAQQVSPVA